MNVLINKVGLNGSFGLTFALGFAVGVIAPVVLTKVCEIAALVFKSISTWYANLSWCKNCSQRNVVQVDRSASFVPAPLDRDPSPPSYTDKKI